MIKKNLYPGTKILVAFSFLTLVFGLPLRYQALVISLGMLIALKTKPLPSKDPGSIFIKLWLAAALFLFLIHCIRWNGELVFNKEGLQVAGSSFFRIGSLMTVFLWFIRRVKPEEIYAMLIDFHLPVKMIYLLFQAIHLISRFGEKAKEILLAQQARGFILKGIRNRLTAYILILAPLFSTMIYELEENAAVISAKGLYAPGKKSHLTQIRFTLIDVIIIGISITITMITLLVFKN